MKKPIALFDMDGTLFDFELRIKEEWNKIRWPHEPPFKNIDIHNDKEEWVKNRLNIIKSVPGFWRTLPPYRLGWEILKETAALGFNIHILSKGPYSKPFAWTEKIECIKDAFGREGFGDPILHMTDVVSETHITEDKSIYYGKVLVDDYIPYVKSWLEHRPRGLAIMPANSDHTNRLDHPQAIFYDGLNMQEIIEALNKIKVNYDEPL